MAYLRKGMGEDHPQVGPGRFSAAFLGTLGWVAAPCIGIVAIAWSAATLASLHSSAALSIETFRQNSLLQQSIPADKDTRPILGKAVMLASAGTTQSLGRFDRSARTGQDVKARLVAADPFAAVIAKAKLSRGKLHAALAGAGMKIAAPEVEPAHLAALAMPSAERFDRADSAGNTPVVPQIPEVSLADPLSNLALGRTGLNVELAYASVAASPGDPVALALASLDFDPVGTAPDSRVSTDEFPDSIAAPAARPERDMARPRRQSPAIATKPDAPDNSGRQQSQQALAYARPDKPAGGMFKNLFNTPRAGNGVAIYDISAAVVHMPDGTKLEAHSGIGKMADNPRYVHVKMNGPTPPNTYKLTMREKRFHGVEAVRMTPIGKETMHGRDGILAHSYLLRGGRAESHGCIAFKDYNRFLKAFKQGKVTHIVVVPSLSKAPKLQLVSNGRGA